MEIILRAGVRAPETNSSEVITSPKLIVCRRVAADTLQLVRRGRDYAEPVTVLSNGRTCDQSDAPFTFQNRLLF
jgi:hypothetical protein